MFSITVLGSGSAGNSALVETPGARLLVDAGLSARQTALRLGALGIAPEQLDAILLTHEHTDHAGAIGVWSRKTPTPVYANALTADALRHSQREAVSKVDWRIVQTGAAFVVKDLTIESFAVPHDAAEPLGFVLRHGDCSLGYLTDLGFATRLAHERVRGCHTLFIETNHDEKLLQNDTKRPWSVKQRIMSRHGHLSNAAAAAVIGELAVCGLRRAVLGHLSRDCNSPELAIGTVRARLGEIGGTAEVDLFCASQAEATPRFAIG